MNNIEKKEIEIRARISAPETIRRRLLAQGFTSAGTIQQLDTMLDHPDASLFRSGRKLRLRTEGDATELTFKGYFEGDTKASRRVEINVSLKEDQVAPVASILEALGYPVCFQIPKARASYTKDDLNVVLDDWPIIGTLMEIEGPEDHAQELATTLCPRVQFANYRLREFFQQVERETGKPLAQLQAEYESRTGQRLGRLDLLLS